MGTAPFALPSLNALFEAGFNIASVFTQPDKPRGRGQLLQAPPVKQRAAELHLPITQPHSLKVEETQQFVRDLAPDLIVVVAYGKLLPSWLLAFPKYGCINVHGSLLPKYRGAAPVHWAVANGEEKTGVCTMLLDEGLDTGPVYGCSETSVRPDETAAQLYDRLAVMGGPLIVRTVEGILSGTLKPNPQDDSGATIAPRLKKEDGFLNWEWPAHAIHNRVRAFNPWPGTVTQFRDMTCKILKTVRHDSVAESSIYRPPQPFEPGSLRTSKGRLAVICGDGMALEILSIQPENRKAISGGDFANGVRIQTDEKFVPLKDN